MTEEWILSAEEEADLAESLADIKAGRTRTFDNVEDLLAYLNSDEDEVQATMTEGSSK